MSEFPSPAWVGIGLTTLIQLALIVGAFVTLRTRFDLFAVRVTDDLDRLTRGVEALGSALTGVEVLRAQVDDLKRRISRLEATR